MTVGEILPHINAVMNTVSCVALASGYVAIKNKRIDVHHRCMITAVVASAIFLAGYLTRFALTGVHKFPDVGVIKTIYLALLFSHMLLALAVVPIVFRMLYLAKHARFVDHKKLGRIGFPIWLYVSVTGVVVYAMLYHLAPRLVETDAPPVLSANSAVCMR
jgi:putative membrane protein